ncbi:serine/threonine-protein kinase [Leptolyngbya sp. FACHB-261]|uniref:serine/threonine-protein kinase n=1 Tax=Leptolyngbya sp. FACHB-261 TaxID=2692806 RepID=UPI0016820540|nr:serine/threonine-protein kinase [Leptolyngbya sp. FACHB-261]MBD2104788.1 pentapeptide repeat-containing protein [Leptolyngbya sp. FACHB-261]
MSYCFNPVCPNPENLTHTRFCQACNHQLLLHERYRAVEPLGRGGFGATFLSQDESQPELPLFVVKQLRPVATAPQALKMAKELFEREANTLAKVGVHQQVPSLLDYFSENEEFYLVQQYVEGETLKQEVERRGAFNEVEVRQFLIEVLPVLEFVHQNRVIHRDIKPANLIRAKRDGRLVLIDFGAVKHQVQAGVVSNDASDLSESDRTALTAFAIGTAGFAPPEQMALRPVYASDIYALGMTCLYLLTGRSPKHLAHDPLTGEVIWQDQVVLSPHLDAILKKMLEDSVRQRYRSANEVLRDLDLAPHLQTLAQGLMAQQPSKPAVPTYRSAFRKGNSTTGGHSGSQGNSEGNSGSQTSSGLSQLAMAIRRRRAENATTTNSAGKLTPAVVRPIVIAASARPPVHDAEREARTVRNDYTKGVRNFAGRNLTQAALQAALLSGSILTKACLLQANLRGADLRHCDLGHANLVRADLRDSLLTDAYLSHADLSGADLRGADLRNVYLRNANLRGANLCGANLSGAKLSDEQLAQARTNLFTVRPERKNLLW